MIIGFLYFDCLGKYIEIIIWCDKFIILSIVCVFDVGNCIVKNKCVVISWCMNYRGWEGKKVIFLIGIVVDWIWGNSVRKG